MGAKLQNQRHRDPPHKKSKRSSKASTQSSSRNVSPKCVQLSKPRSQKCSLLDASRCHIKSLALNSKVSLTITKL